MPFVKGMGRKIAEDSRDVKYPMRSLIRPVHLPKYRYYDFRNRSVPLDQGNTSCCVAFAWTGFLYASPLQCSNPPSPYELYRKVVLVDEWEENDFEATEPKNDMLQSGTSVRAGAKMLQTMGHVRSYVWSDHADEMANWLLAGLGTIVVGTNWYWDMGEPDKKGFAHIGGGIAGGHAYLIMGYNRVTMAFRCINSWGKEFGVRGRFWIAHKDMERLISEQGEACSAVEQLVLPIT